MKFAAKLIVPRDSLQALVKTKAMHDVYIGPHAYPGLTPFNGTKSRPRHASTLRDELGRKAPSQASQAEILTQITERTLCGRMYGCSADHNGHYDKH